MILLYFEIPILTVTNHIAKLYHRDLKYDTIFRIPIHFFEINNFF